MANYDEEFKYAGTQLEKWWYPGTRENIQALRIKELNEFCHKCAFFSLSLHSFRMFAYFDDFDQREAWRDIFSHTLTYPAPRTHPANRMIQELGDPLLTFARSVSASRKDSNEAPKKKSKKQANHEEKQRRKKLR